MLPGTLPSPTLDSNKAQISRPAAPETKNKLILPDQDVALAILDIAFKIRKVPKVGDRAAIAKATDEPDNYLRLVDHTTKIPDAKSKVLTLEDWKNLLATVYSDIYKETEIIFNKNNATGLIAFFVSTARSLKHAAFGDNYVNVYLKDLMALYNYCRGILQKNDSIKKYCETSLQEIVILNDKILNIRNTSPYSNPVDLIKERDQKLLELINLGSDKAADMAQQWGIIVPHQRYGDDLMKDNNKYRFNTNIPLFCNIVFYEYYVHEIIFKTKEAMVENENSIPDFENNSHDRRKPVEPEIKGVTDLKGKTILSDSKQAATNAEPTNATTPALTSATAGQSSSISVPVVMTGPTAPNQNANDPAMVNNTSTVSSEKAAPAEVSESVKTQLSDSPKEAKLAANVSPNAALIKLLSPKPAQVTTPSPAKRISAVKPLTPGDRKLFSQVLKSSRQAAKEAEAAEKRALETAAALAAEKARLESLGINTDSNAVVTRRTPYGT